MIIDKNINDVDWNDVQNMVTSLYEITERLENIFVGRKFTLDGHLVGSIGEVLAAYMFDLDLTKGSTKSHDAVTKQGKNIQIKLTQTNRKIGINSEPEHLVVLQKLKYKKVEIIYNGPGKVVWELTTDKGGPQRFISVSKLKLLDQSVNSADRLILINDAPF